MKINEIREMTADELAVQARENKEEILNLRIQQRSGQLENPSRIRELRRDIARIETVLSERHGEGASSTAMAAGAGVSDQ